MLLRHVRATSWKSFADTEDIELGRINILLGKNNSGKSALIQAIHQMQSSAALDVRDIRIGETEAKIEYDLEQVDFVRHFPDSGALGPGGINNAVLTATITKSPDGGAISNHLVELSQSSSRRNMGPIPAQEPQNFIYPYLSQRKVSAYDGNVDLSKSRAVSSNLSFLVSKVSMLANFDHPQSQRYSELCKQLLGFRVSALPATGGQQAGIHVGRYDSIYLDDMGDGVPNLVGIIVDLCMAEGNLFLIEELENDIHPEGLKSLLRVIADESPTNQFIISTHSNIVAKFLGASDDSHVFEISQDYERNRIPTSTIRQIERSSDARISVLRQLGYELHDFELWEAWIILEESTAERVVRDFLIPQFAPRLSRVRPISAGGVTKAAPTFEDFRRLFLFAHLEPAYRERAWVVVDGDAEGVRTVDALRVKYSDWDPRSFRTWSAESFEEYYPARFQADTYEMQKVRGREKRDAKKNLVQSVIEWCDTEPSTARKEFAESAREVIEFLREVESHVFPDEDR